MDLNSSEYQQDTCRYPLCLNASGLPEAFVRSGHHAIAEFQRQMLIYEEPVLVDFVHGDATGLVIPAHGDALRDAGAAFLTDAFRAFGFISDSNRVTCITRIEPCAAGNSGHKLFLSVEYAQQEPGLHSDLFVKFSRDFTDSFRDRRRYELEAEVHFAALSRLPHFPICVPAACFADFHRESGTGLLITQRIAFGRDNIEPLRAKCMDHELADPLAYYRAIVTTLARLAAAHKSGLLSPQVETFFPFDATVAVAADPIPWNEQQLRERVARYAAFAQSHPQLLPARLATPQFIARLEREAVLFLRHETAIKRYLHANRDFIALCHYNANIDNAWFWRDSSGTLQCGLLDWGRVRQMNVAYGLWGGLCGASLDIWDKHFDELLALFVNELHAHGGPLLDRTELRLHLHLYVATMSLSMMMDAPALVLARLPEAGLARNQLDPIFHQHEFARSFLHVFTAFLNLWDRHDFGASLNQLLARTPST